MNRVLLFGIVACFGVLTASAGIMKSMISSGAIGAPEQTAQAMMAAPAEPAAPTKAAGGNTVTLKPDQSGQYHAEVTVNGRTIRMLVDTGASLVALTQQDAITLGVLPLSFNVPVQTANGTARAGEAKLSDIRIGGVQVAETKALVLPYGVTGHSLLGMSFLKKLSGFEVAGGNLILKQ